MCKYCGSDEITGGTCKYDRVSGQVDAYVIPPCKGYFTDTMDGRDFDCEYISSADFDCDSCICVTSKYGDFSGIDPTTGKKFKAV